MSFAVPISKTHEDGARIKAAGAREDVETPRTPGGGLRFGRDFDRGRRSERTQRSRSEDPGRSPASPAAPLKPKRSETLFASDLRRLATSKLTSIELKGRQSVSMLKRVATIILAEYPLEVMKENESCADKISDDESSADSDSEDHDLGVLEPIPTPLNRFRVSECGNRCEPL